MQRIYFDNAATTPLAEEVMAEMMEAMRDNYGNPSSIHAEGRKARAAIEDARKRVAKLLNASIGEIFFTSGGTESSNMVLKNAVRDLGVRRIISSPIEHHCVLHTVERLAREQGITRELVNIDEKGRVDYDHLAELLAAGEEKTLVSLMHANNEIGTMLDLDRVADLCAEHNALFHSDTVQSMGFYPIDVSRTRIHFLTGSAHKFHGPKGVGFVYINGDAIIQPYLDGGAQERNMRGGTENIYGILGMAKGLELAYQKLPERETHIRSLRTALRAGLEGSFDQIRFYGDTEGGIYKLLNVGFPPSAKTDMLLLNLDIAGVSVSGGSACSSGADAGSHVIEALGGEPGWKAVRFSFSYLNTRAEVDLVLEHLRACLPVGTAEV